MILKTKWRVRQMFSVEFRWDARSARWADRKKRLTSIMNIPSRHLPVTGPPNGRLPSFPELTTSSPRETKMIYTSRKNKFGNLDKQVDSNTRSVIYVAVLKSGDFFIKTIVFLPYQCLISLIFWGVQSAQNEEFLGIERFTRRQKNNVRVVRVNCTFHNAVSIDSV